MLSQVWAINISIYLVIYAFWVSSYFLFIVQAKPNVLFSKSNSMQSNAHKNILNIYLLLVPKINLLPFRNLQLQPKKQRTIYEVALLCYINKNNIVTQNQNSLAFSSSLPVPVFSEFSYLYSGSSFSFSFLVFLFVNFYSFFILFYFLSLFVFWFSWKATPFSAIFLTHWN